MITIKTKEQIEYMKKPEKFSPHAIEKLQR